MRKKLAVFIALAMSLTVALTGSTAANAKEDTSKLNLIKPGSLVVGMTLQFPPQMYLNSSGKPAGYDYELLKRLARTLGLKLEVKNIAFDGLISGLVAKQFDMVSVGFGKRPEREKSMTYAVPYMPYTTILVQGKSDKTGSTVANWNSDGVKITALKGSTSATLIKNMFPKATLVEFPVQDSAFLEVASGRANGIVVEENLFGYFNKNNPGLIKKVNVSLQDVYPGWWTVQLGNTALSDRLKSWFCEKQDAGVVASVFRQQMGYKMPTLPNSCS